MLKTDYVDLTWFDMGLNPLLLYHMRNILCVKLLYADSTLVRLCG